MVVEIKGGFVKVTIGNEMYVYFGGSLLYKRWINQGKGRIFHTPGKLQQMKTIQITQHELNQATRPNVYKNKKKYTRKGKLGKWRIDD